ncbi:protein containing DUF1009 [Candidatus Omnitrophus magneticus]|uniref:Protein containing DUF1009 n=1 Tax=Candidatus Omnitrophus magneticus TaxID=1609969 RepID=A0A0F0CMI6_9BACT|nr:protein containing DUF1009 [Candidatus Omnitrophus magneticus]
MGKIGLIAGAGELPLEFARSAKQAGEEVFVFAVKDVAKDIFSDTAVKVYWVSVGDYARLVFILLKERVKKIAFLGKFKKEVLEKNPGDKEWQSFVKELPNRMDYTILDKATSVLSKIGVEVVSPICYLKHLFPEEGILTKNVSSPEVLKNMEFGYEIARKIADIDIGQTIIVKNKSIVAVEAMEGTDSTIERGFKVGGEGCVMIKSARSNQDMRWDVPTVGLKTMEQLISNKYAGLAIQSGKMYLLNKEEFIKKADEYGILIKVF